MTKRRPKQRPDKRGLHAPNVPWWVIPLGFVLAPFLWLGELLGLIKD